MRTITVTQIGYQHFGIITAVESPDTAGVGTGIGVGIAVLVVIIIIIAIIIVITVVVKLHTRPKCPGEM